VSDAENTKSATSPQDLERVREILFGGVIRDHDARFATVQRDLERLQKALDRANEELAKRDSAQNQKLQEARQEFQRESDELRAELRSSVERLGSAKVDKEQLGNLFIEMGNQIKGNGTMSAVLDGLLQVSE
jgi:chromosome segregation ATPase